MKQKLFTYLTMGLIVAATACKKGNDEVKPEPDGGGVVTNGKFSGKVDNASFGVSEIGCISATGAEEIFLLTATDKNDNSIVLTGPNATGTFTQENNENVHGMYVDKDGKMWMTELEGGSITLKITKFDKGNKKVSGTYTFTATPFTFSEASGNKIVSGSFEDVKFYEGVIDEESFAKRKNPKKIN